MQHEPGDAESSASRLPLPLAQLYRRACNAKDVRERHNAAYYLWEASVKLLGSVAVVSYVERSDADKAVTERLRNLARPALGHWWEFIRLLTPRLGDAGFRPIAEFLFGKTRSDLPGAAGLDAALRAVLEGETAARSTVEPARLFDRLVTYRNREIGHGAAGQRPSSHYDRMGRSLLLGVGELLSRIDPLAGHRLVYIPEVRRRSDGSWIVEQADLSREMYQRVESLVLPADAADRLPRPERLYLRPGDAPSGPMRSLHPLVIYDAEADEVLFLNSRRGKAKAEYLDYSSGRVLEQAELAGEQRELMRQILNMPAEEVTLDAWAARLAAEEIASADPGAAEAPQHEPRRLGEFELISELGRGAMGVVYRAEQPSLQRQVAVKRMFRTGDPKAEARFAREIRALGQVDHPHLVKIHASGSDGEHWFYAMERIDGTTLAAVCERLQASGSTANGLELPTWHDAISTACVEARRKEQPLREDAARNEAGPAPVPKAVPQPIPHPMPHTSRSYERHAVELVRQVAEAAHALHLKGIIHRDIKPGNIMVTADGDMAVLMDLGLAQVADEVEGRLTRTRQFVGTLRYASPEQVQAVRRLDARSDVYSLGATLWELLTLKPLFGATDATPTPKLMEQIGLDEPSRVRAHNRSVSRDLEKIVEKCLQKKAMHRYATARELSDDLGRFLNGEPVRARQVTSLERGVKWARRRPALASLIAALILATAGLVAMLDLSRRQSDQSRRQAEDHARAETTAKDEAVALKNAATKALLKSDWQLYASNIALAQGAWKEDDVRLMHHYLGVDACRPDFRGWEHDFLVALANKNQKTLHGHLRPITSVAFSSDGKRIASASEDGTVMIWEGTTGRVSAVLKGHTGAVTSVAFRDDGKRLVSGSADKTAKIWDTETGQELRSFEGHEAEVLSVAFRRDGTQIASGSYDQTAKVWNANSGALLFTFRKHEAGIGSIQFRGDGKQVVSASDDTIRVWDATAGDESLCFKAHAAAITAAACSPDGKRIVSAARDGSVRVWNATDGRQTTSLEGHLGPVTSVAFRDDGKQVVSGSEDNTVKVWDSTSGKALTTLKGHTDVVSAVAFRGDGKQIASGSADKTLKIWDAALGQEPLALKGHARGVTCVMFSKDGAKIVSGSLDRTLKVWDAKTGEESQALRDHTGPVTSLAWSVDGTRIVSGSGDGTLKIWGPSFDQVPRTLTGHTRGVVSVACSGDGKRIVSGSGDGSARIWDALTGQELLAFKGHGGKAVTSVAFNNCNMQVASGGYDNTVRVWDAKTGEESLSLEGHTNNVTCVAFRRDGEQILSGSFDKTARVWDATSGRELLSLKGHTDWVTSVAFRGDNKQIVTGSFDKTVRIWDAATGAETITLKGHTGPVNCVAFSDDHRRIVSSSADGTVKIWDATTNQELPFAGTR
jgi:WD40 repeat protein/serine/threonine protein kinase